MLRLRACHVARVFANSEAPSLWPLEQHLDAEATISSNSFSFLKGQLKIVCTHYSSPVHFHSLGSSAAMCFQGLEAPHGHDSNVQHLVQKIYGLTVSHGIGWLVRHGSTERSTIEDQRGTAGPQLESAVDVALALMSPGSLHISSQIYILNYPSPTSILLSANLLVEKL